MTLLVPKKIYKPPNDTANTIQTALILSKGTVSSLLSAAVEKEIKCKMQRSPVSHLSPSQA